MADQNDKSFEIHKMDLHTPNLPGETVPLQALYTSLRIHENLFLPYISGEITLYDAAGYTEIFPIIGEEKIELDISVFDPDQSEPNNIKGIFRVTSISPQKRKEGTRGSMYSLVFVSNEYFVNLRQRIYDSYMTDNSDLQLKLSSIVKIIFDKYIKNKDEDADPYYIKNIDVEETYKPYQIIFPNLQPYQAILLCARKALSKNISGATYLFFETLKSFNFKTLENLIEQDPKLILNYVPTSTLDEKALKQVNLQTQTTDIRFIDKFEISKSFDVVDNVSAGMYSSRLITFDFEKHAYREYNYEYVPTHDMRNTVQTLNGKKLQVITKVEKDGSVSLLLDRSKSITDNMLCTQNNDNLNHPQQKTHLTSTNLFQDTDFKTNTKQPGGYKEPGIISSDVEKTQLQRSAQLQQLQNIQIKVTLKKSSTSIYVGVTIKLNMPSDAPQEYNPNVPPSEHFYYSGKYVATVVNHNMTPSGLITELTLAKNALENPMPDFDLSVLSKEKLIEVLEKNQNPDIEYYNTPNFARAAKGGGL